MHAVVGLWGSSSQEAENMETNKESSFLDSAARLLE